MAEKNTQYSEKLKHKGNFIFKDIYTYTYEWLIGEGYEVAEKKYSEEIESDAKKLEIEWEAKKKVSDYFRFIIKIDWKVLRMKEIEVVKEGKKIKMNSGQIELGVKGILVKDYENRWEDHPFWKFLRGVYDRYIIKSRIIEYESKIIEEASEFVDQCKAFLVLEGKK